MTENSGAPSRALITNTALGSGLSEILTGADIVPGSAPSYQLCKQIYLYHPLGAKMAEAPLTMAQSQEREIEVPGSPEDRIIDAFKEQHRKDGIDKHIFNAASLARVYGVSALALLVEGVNTDVPVDYTKLWDATISYNIFDPLNVAGSLVLNQNANAMDFLKTTSITVAGTAYHSSRTCILMNESPIYLGYSTSAFGYVGRSVYQRGLYMLKSYINTLVTDDLITRKSGVLIAAIKAAGSIIDNVMQFVAGIKRSILQEAETDNVISIDPEERIESLDLNNIGPAYEIARKNILENLAVSADMPAKILNAETFAEGFGEGTEDAKNVARFVDRVRVWIDNAYKFCDEITMHRAWNPEFYKTIQADFPADYGKIPYEQAFYEWQKNFRAKWPSLLTEPDSEKVMVQDVKLKAVIAMIEVLAPMLDKETNLPALVQWAADNFNNIEMLFSSPLLLDMNALKEFNKQQADNDQAGVDKELEEPPPPKPFASQDSQRPGRVAYNEAVGKLIAFAEAKNIRVQQRRENARKK